jgi:hypothetical protein
MDRHAPSAAPIDAKRNACEAEARTSFLLHIKAESRARGTKNRRDMMGLSVERIE